MREPLPEALTLEVTAQDRLGQYQFTEVESIPFAPAFILRLRGEVRPPNHVRATGVYLMIRSDSADFATEAGPRGGVGPSEVSAAARFFFGQLPGGRARTAAPARRSSGPPLRDPRTTARFSATSDSPVLSLALWQVLAERESFTGVYISFLNPATQQEERLSISYTSDIDTLSPVSLGTVHTHDEPVENLAQAIAPALDWLTGRADSMQPFEGPVASRPIDWLMLALFGSITVALAYIVHRVFTKSTKYLLFLSCRNLLLLKTYF